jgi:hypothetical protein
MIDKKIFSIVYSENQPCEYTCYNNSHIRTPEQNSFIFEYNPIIDIIDNHTIKEDYLGIFSWKFSFKTGIFRKKLDWILSKQTKEFDVYILCKPLKYPYIAFTEAVHPGFKLRFNFLLKEIGKENFIDKEPKHTVYSNFFIAKKEIYKDFINTWIKPSIFVMENNKELNKLVLEECNYKGLPREQLLAYTGLSYYNYVTFLLERLFSFYLEENNHLKIWKVTEN